MENKGNNGASLTGPGSQGFAPQPPTASSPVGADPSRDVHVPWWFCLILFFGGLTVDGGAIQLLTAYDMPPILGFPVVVGMAVIGTLMAISGLGLLVSQCDSDEHPKGEDRNGLSGEAMPARAEGIAQTPDPSAHNRTEAVREEPQ